MKRSNNPYFLWGLTAFLVLSGCIVVFLVLSKLLVLVDVVGKLMSYLSPVLYGLAFGYILCPLMNVAERNLRRWLARVITNESVVHRIARGGGVTFALGAMLLVVYAVINMILPELTGSVVKLVRDLPDNYARVVAWANGLLADNPVLADTVSNAMMLLEKWLYNDLLPNAQNYLLSLTTSMFSIAYDVFELLVGVIVSVYVMVSKDIFLGQSKKLVCAIFPARRANQVMDLARYAHKTFSGFVVGKILDSLIIGILCFIGMSLLKMPYTLLISVIVGVTNVIPFFGPYIGAIPSAFLILLVSPIQCLYFLIFILALQQFDGNILGPHILGNATGLSGFWVVVAILSFGNLFGIVGMIIGVPTFAVLYTIVSELVNKKLRKRNIDPSQDFQTLQHVSEQSIPVEENKS